jgi:hypothetical protein
MSDNQLTTTNNQVAILARQSSDVAGACREIVKATAQRIGNRDYVRVEGWQAIAVAHGCVASAKGVEKVEGGFRCIGEVRKMENGQVISQAEGFVGDDETMWAGRPEYARRAMVQTRAISRACRSAFAHIVVLIDRNLSTTPAEEVPPGGFEPNPYPTNMGFFMGETPAKAPDKFAEKIVAQVANEKIGGARDMVLNFGKHKGSTLREIAAFPSGKGLDYLDWLAKQELKPGKDGKPFKNDIIRNEIIREILLEAEAVTKENPDDQIPF